MIKNTARLALVSLILLGGCKYFSSGEGNLKPVARVFDKYLYEDDLLAIIPAGTSKEDSAQIAQTFIDNWIKQNVIISQAEDNLSNDQKNFDMLVENYRNSLLIYNYEKALIDQKLDTNLTDEELDTYFKDNTANFKLNDYLLKAFFVKVDAGKKVSEQVQRLIRSDKARDIEELRHICNGSAIDYSFNDQVWISGNDLSQKVPLTAQRKSEVAVEGKVSVVSDGKFDYIVYTLDSYSPGELPPMEVVKDDVRVRMINKRKVELIEKMRTDLLNDALNNKNAETY
ncbi:MAG: peptidylprolyl isomerase [Bacteroidota bacterium]